MKTEPIPFNRPYATGKELIYAAESQRNYHLSGDGPFTKRCHAWIEDQTGCAKALLTHSCTAALEMAALLLKVQPGDEVIMPSYTFVSTANAFVLRGAKPIFVDIREDTLNLDETLIESAITSRTRAIVPVHYAGVACEMDTIIAIAQRHGLKVVEDAAQGAMAHYNGRALGAIGDLGAYSFHDSKNIISGEGGSLLINDPGLAARAEIIREKGTDRSRFFRGEVDGPVSSADLAQGLRTQWPYVLYSSRARDRSADDSRCPQSKRNRRGISLCPAAFLARRTTLRPGAWGSRRYDLRVAAVDPVAAVDRVDASSAGKGVRGVQGGIGCGTACSLNSAANGPAATIARLR